MYKLIKYLTISCAHHLLDSDSLITKKCLNNHGHNYLIEVKIETEELQNGMVIDFGKLKEIVNKLDHQNLNNFIENPTAENIAEYLQNKIIDELIKLSNWRSDSSTVEVTVRESSDSSVTYY